MRGTWVIGCIVAGIAWQAASVGPAAASLQASHQQTLLNGVSAIAAPGVPGCLVPMGDKAFALVVGNRGPQDAVAVGCEWKSGRVVALGHGGYLSAETWKQADTQIFLMNAIQWTARSSKKPPRIGIVQHEDLQNHLRSLGQTVVALSGPQWPRQLGQIDVLIAATSHMAQPEQRKAVAQFITAGGGLITADTPWGWAQLNPKKTLVADHPGNLLLYPAGILFTGSYNGRTTASGFKAGTPPSAMHNATVALAALIEHHHQRSKLSQDDLTQAVHTLSGAISVLPLNDRVILGRLRDHRVSQADKMSWPSTKKPIKAADGLLRALVALDVREMKETPPRDVKPHPAAEHFPGSVPSSAKAADKPLTIDTAIPGWHSTGLYARPGQAITVSLPANAVQQGLEVRIGCHNDSLWHLKSWQRMPEVCITAPLQQTQTLAANAMGGLVYIVVPERSKLGKVSMRVSGAVPAPLFVLGQTTNQEWIAEISQQPAPWAELAGKNLIITLPSKAIRELRNPEELMRKWDEVLDAQADLAQIPKERKRPERIVMDEQISAGYMHAGYPIMTHLDVQNNAVKLDLVAKGGEMWGFFHELGHNHQESDWTFEGTGEVTVNLFTMYVMETVCGRTDKGRAELITQRPQMIKKYMDRGAKFEDWKADPFLALIMYIQLQEAFGWQPYKDVFAEYRQLPRQERPRTEEEKRNQWMVRFSRRVGKNLGPFFQKWGVPTSEAARKSIQDLPEWMPPEFASGR